MFVPVKPRIFNECPSSLEAEVDVNTATIDRTTLGLEVTMPLRLVTILKYFSFTSCSNAVESPEHRLK